ncbi:hypothetical protein C3432_27295, partial [Citrobacter amalonaticus]
MELADGATFTLDNALINRYWNDDDRLINVLSGSAFTNSGEITVSDSSLIYALGAGSSAINNKTIEVNRTSAAHTANVGSVSAMFAEGGSVVTNNGRIIGKILNQDGIFNSNNERRISNPGWINNGVISQNMMEAFGAGSRGINNATGEIEVYGRGSAMAAADNANMDNYGKITTDAMWKSADDTTELPANVLSSTVRDFAVGMDAGADNSGNSYGRNATATNHQGATITINNAGAGMVAYGNNQVINQGTINLEKNENYDASKPLVGMAVYKGGTAINDTTGVININAENGQAFYSDGNAGNRIVNRGQITLGEHASTGADNSAEIASAEFADGSILTGTTTLSKNTSVMPGSTVSNTGTVDGTSTLTVDGTYNNQTGAVTSVPLTVNASGVVNNNGTLNSGNYKSQTLNVTSGTLNNTGTINGSVRTTGSAKVNNSGTITQGFDISGTTSLVNSGTVASGPTGSGGDTTLMYLRDSSVLTNDTAGTVMLNTAKNSMYLASKSTFVNKGSVEMSQASNGGAINLNSGGGVVINQGTMTGNGATMVNVRSGGTASATTGWIWNQTGGVMDFTAGTGNNAVAINTTGSSGIKSLNDGTINLHGNGAIGMKGSNTSQLVNNG